MDSRNVIMAVILSTLVLILWSVFFSPPVIEKQTTEQQISNDQNTSSLSIEKKEDKKQITRDAAISNTNRINLENENIKGSISLQGGIIDDVVFKNYKETLDGESKVIFLNPKNSAREYFIETGWAQGGNEKTKLPADTTIWKIKGNSTLTPNNPILLEWDNAEGLFFTKKIELDEKFLFKITQGIKNKFTFIKYNLESKKRNYFNTK